jgi:dihydrofolate reductase
MRKLKLQMQLSLDGFAAAGANDEQKWVTWAWDEIKEYVLELSDSTDTEIIGRKLAVDYIPYWLNTYKHPGDPMFEVAKRFVAKNKIVFTKTLEASDAIVNGWENTTLAKGNLKQTVNDLKMLDGKDIIVYGGCSFVSALIREGLVDEFHFFINPVALGSGWRIFDELKSVQQLQLKHSITYNSGIVLLCYKPKGDPAEKK